MARIIVTYSSVDGVKRTEIFTDIEQARSFAHEWVGPHPDLGRSYAVSNDGVGKIVVNGATLNDIFPPRIR